MQQDSVKNRAIRRAYRKRLLPKVQQCLLGKATPEAVHHSRSSLDSQTAAEILACFEGDTWLTNVITSAQDMLVVWQHWAYDQSGEVSIGKFVRHLYDAQVEHDELKLSQTDDPAVTIGSLHEKRLALLATLYIAGYLPKFEPESLLELV